MLSSYDRWLTTDPREAGAIALRDATRDLAMPNMDAHELTHLVHCLKFCPKLGAVA